MCQKDFVKKIETGILCSVTVFFENPTVSEIKKYRRAGQATYYTMVHAHCMLDT
jgi:hypothetical protein